MGRRKGYDRREVLDRAMEAFWEGGYHATTSRQLAGKMQVNIGSVYSEFGSKEGLYQAALERYDETVVTHFFGPLESPDATLTTVVEVLWQFPVMARSVAEPPGCLITNAAVERAPSADLSRDAMAGYLRRVGEGIERALSNTSSLGEVADETLRALAHQTVAVLIGLFVMTRAQTDPDVLDDVVRGAVRQLQAHTRKP